MMRGYLSCVVVGFFFVAASSSSSFRSPVPFEDAATTGVAVSDAPEDPWQPVIDAIEGYHMQDFAVRDGWKKGEGQWTVSRHPNPPTHMPSAQSTPTGHGGQCLGHPVHVRKGQYQLDQHRHE